ncbi:MAG: MFS transporter [Acidobacteria bacterium]|nr:MFS transporter [Acidobacteriota bacterium]
MSAPSPITDREATFRALLLAVFLAAAEATVVSTALPRIVADLGGLRLYGWAGSSYLLASTVTMPLFGRLADLHGRKPIFQIGLALFFAGSALCGWAFSFPMLLAGRVVQGLGAGSIQPVAMTLIGDLYPVEERARVQGIVGSIWAVAGVAGPLLGALLVEGPGWRWVFWVNLPFAAGSAFAIQRALHEPRREGERAPLDLLGALLLVVAAVSLLLAAEGVAPLLTGTLALTGAVAFVFQERRARSPLLPLPLLARPEVGIASGAALASGALLMGSVLYLPLWVQGVAAKSPATSGLALGPMLVGWPIAATLSIRWARATSFRHVARVGALLIVGGALALSTAVLLRSPIPVVGASTFLLGAGLGLAVTSLLVSLQTRVGFAQRGVATAVTLFARTLGGALGVGVLGALLARGLGEGEIARQIRMLLAPGAERAALDASATAVLEASLLPVWISFVLLAALHGAVVSRYPRRLAEPDGDAGVSPRS